MTTPELGTLPPAVTPDDAPVCPDGQRTKLPLRTSSGAHAAGSTQQQPQGMDRLTSALHVVLACGLASDFVEGLVPQLLHGRLAIATHARLSDGSPALIGMWPNLPAAVAAQKEAHTLTAGLHPELARRVLAAHCACRDEQHHQAASTSADVTGLALASPGSDAGTPHSPCSVTREASAACDEPPAPAAAADATAAATAVPALTDSVVSLLLRKGLEALQAQARGQAAGASAQQPAAPPARRQLAQQGTLQRASSTCSGDAWASGTHPDEQHQQQDPLSSPLDPATPYLQQQHQQQPLHFGSGGSCSNLAGLAALAADVQQAQQHAALWAAAAAAASSGLPGHQPPGFGHFACSIHPAAAAAAAAGAEAAAGYLDPAAATTTCWGLPAAGLAASYGSGAWGSGDLSAAAAAAAAAAAPWDGSGGDTHLAAASGAGSQTCGKRKQGPGSNEGQGGPAAAGGAAKSVACRVSRFPPDLHKTCCDHWERTGCARVVCNDVPGVMSVQNGRCVVTYSHGGSEVLKGVADFLRYAGEPRIKKWRRHVRMTDFARPGKACGELMTAEEFLAVVGDAAGVLTCGGKRARRGASPLSD